MLANVVDAEEDGAEGTLTGIATDAYCTGIVGVGGVGLLPESEFARIRVSAQFLTCKGYIV